MPLREQQPPPAQPCGAGLPVLSASPTPVLEGADAYAHDGHMHDGPDAFDDAIVAALARWDMPTDSKQHALFRAHFDAVVETNRTMNLTRITDPAEAAVKHYADSLALLLWARGSSGQPRTVLDVGTGAGFPAIPLAVMRPDWAITAIDATKKKIDFVRETARAMGLDNVSCQHGHSRHWKPQRTFDLVLLRAVTALPEAVEQAVAHLAPTGSLVCYKTARTPPAELRAADELCKTLRLRSVERFPYDLALGEETLGRMLCIFGRA